MRQRTKQRRKSLHSHVPHQKTHVDEIKRARSEHFSFKVMHILHHVGDVWYASKDMPQSLVDEKRAFIDPVKLHIGVPPGHLIDPCSYTAANIEHPAHAREVERRRQSIAH